MSISSSTLLSTSTPTRRPTSTPTPTTFTTHTLEPGKRHITIRTRIVTITFLSSTRLKQSSLRTIHSSANAHVSSKAKEEAETERNIGAIFGAVPCPSAFLPSLFFISLLQASPVYPAHFLRTATMPSTYISHDPILPPRPTTPTSMATSTSSAVYRASTVSSWTRTSSSRFPRPSPPSFFFPVPIVPVVPPSEERGQISGKGKMTSHGVMRWSAVVSADSSLAKSRSSSSIFPSIRASTHPLSSTTTSLLLLPHVPYKISPVLASPFHHHYSAQSPAVPPLYTAFLTGFMLGLLMLLVWLINLSTTRWGWSLSTPSFKRASFGPGHWIRRRGWALWCRALGGSWAKREGKGKSKDRKRTGTEGKPIDKPSKYADLNLHSRPGTSSISSSGISPTTKSAQGALGVLASGIHIHTTVSPQALKYRRHTSRAIASSAPPHQLPRAPSTHVPQPRNPSVQVATLSSRTAQTLESVVNPYLCTPPGVRLASLVELKHRSSTEWLDERSEFFGREQKVSEFGIEAGTVAARDARAIGDLEAGTASDTLISSHCSSSSSLLKSAGTTRSKMREKGSWVDSGLAMVDGAVGMVVEKVARWTDDVDGREDEGLVLPLARE